jgi:hypothetical protein
MDSISNIYTTVYRATSALELYARTASNEFVASFVIFSSKIIIKVVFINLRNWYILANLDSECTPIVMKCSGFTHLRPEN